MIVRWLKNVARAGSCCCTRAVQTTGGIGDFEPRSQAHPEGENCSIGTHNTEGRAFLWELEPQRRLGCCRRWQKKQRERKEKVPNVPSSCPPLFHQRLPLSTSNWRPEGKVNPLACYKNRAREGQAMNPRAKKQLTCNPLFVFSHLYSLIIKYWQVYLLIS